MTVTVEDGSQVANSNSYVSENELTAYATARGVTPSTDLEQLIVKSMDYIEGLDFNGWKSSSTQSLQWPRSGVYIDDYSVDSDSIPQLLKDAQMSTCLEIEAGNNPLATIKQEKQSVTVGPISTTYKTGSSSSPISKTINTQLRKLLSGGGSGFSVNR